MTDLIDVFWKTSPRARKALLRLLNEYETLRKIENSTAPLTHTHLFQAILTHEKEQSQIDIPRGGYFSRGNDTRLPENYSAEWSKAFLQTVEDYKNQTNNYKSTVEKFEEFKRSDLPKIRDILRKVDLLSPEKCNIYALLRHLNEQDLTATAMGTIEAHWQMRRVVQLYYGRYSAEMRDIDRDRIESAFDMDNPSPDLRSYSHRQNKRTQFLANMERKPGQFQIDNAVYLALYLDFLNDFSYQPTWTLQTHWLYAQKMVLIPGLAETEDFLSSAKRGQENIQLRMAALRDEIRDWMRENPEDDLTDLRAGYALLASRAAPTLCLMNALKGCAYVGEFDERGRAGVASIVQTLSLDIFPDAYHPDRIVYDWSPILAMWERESQQAASRQTPPIAKTKSKGILLTKEEKIAIALNKAAAAGNYVPKDNPKKKPKKSLEEKELERQQKKAAEEKRRQKEAQNAQTVRTEAAIKSANKAANKRKRKAAQKAKRDARKLRLKAAQEPPKPKVKKSPPSEPTPA